ncbi:hypothetical protein E2C00_22485 [Streptomyces sp. WAC05374]|uniref:hypothetical protein n=1 Tax=Streptomyces sp. WAC05374 TaxID=2487420 RepID=UPI000F868D77|nr:hypothetical protein [Streptomyces sp. WAC05374]RST13931.1 hypothetical protein EF905_19080 [Streptomyces sp. WAC05374]TDF46026.1 hypothetical protein E2B92_11490 [Streptomyces sp. WAC05374]TDF53017.1 hypothetical protein E2C00_22485 [Streptomyces sp. WAC05374]TDF58233.1 hypothetical protein E2C02_06875 [Streptomyces sp. WAC05374]
MSRALRAFTVGTLVVGCAGYAATEYLASTTGTATPPSPYASEPAPPDCAARERHPAGCPPPGGESPGDHCGPAFRAEARSSAPPPGPGLPVALPTGDPGTDRLCSLVVVTRDKE